MVQKRQRERRALFLRGLIFGALIGDLVDTYALMDVVLIVYLDFVAMLGILR